MKQGIHLAIAAAATLTLLGGVYAEKRAYHTPAAEAVAYHERVRASAADLLPTRVANWLGRDVQLPPSAVRMLHPNVTVAREFVQVGTSRRAELLVVHCADARDLLGHYPPVCYRGRGYTQQSHELRSWQAGGRQIAASRYVFAPRRVDQAARVVVNFMMLPDGVTCPDMDAVESAARDHREKFFGAAQIQITFDASLPEGVQDDFVQGVLMACSAWFDVVRVGD
jgi:hypothetical protein